MIEQVSCIMQKDEIHIGLFVNLVSSNYSTFTLKG
jgi:hypothetical protein